MCCQITRDAATTVRYKSYCSAPPAPRRALTLSLAAEASLHQCLCLFCAVRASHLVKHIMPSSTFPAKAACTAFVRPLCASTLLLHHFPCRAVVYKGELPAPTSGNSADADAAAEHEPELAAVPGQLDTTPSLIEAAAAGIISLPPAAPPGFLDQQVEQQGLPSGFGALHAAAAAAAGPFATRQAALAAAGDDACSSSQAAGAGAVGSDFVSQSSLGSLLSQASSSRLMQPLSAAQVGAAMRAC
jgi:hypothetical protein